MVENTGEHLIKGCLPLRFGISRYSSERMTWFWLLLAAAFMFWMTIPHCGNSAGTFRNRKPTYFRCVILTSIYLIAALQPVKLYHGWVRKGSRVRIILWEKIRSSGPLLPGI